MVKNDAVKPAAGLLNPAFVYVHSTRTDIRETFQRVCPNWFTRPPVQSAGVRN